MTIHSQSSILKEFLLILVRKLRISKPQTHRTVLIIQLCFLYYHTVHFEDIVIYPQRVTAKLTILSKCTTE